jgi:hypothetical protein
MTQMGSFILYSLVTKETGASRSASREAEGTGPETPRQPAQPRVVPIPVGCRASDERSR